MHNEGVVVTTKKCLIEWISQMNDDNIIIYPVWGLHGQMKCPTNKQPNPSIDIRLCLSTDVIKDSDKTIKNLYNLKCHPIMFVNQDKAEETLTPEALELYKTQREKELEAK